MRQRQRELRQRRHRQEKRRKERLNAKRLTRLRQTANEAPLVEKPTRQKSQKRDWRKEIATHPIADVIGKLGAIPDEHLDAVLDRLLQLPASDPHILHKQIHDFLRRVHSRLARVDCVAGPMVVAHIGYLVAMSEYVGARELLERFPLPDQSALGGLVAYLRYVIDKPAHFTDRTSYSTLSAEDQFLGACYYEGKASLTLTKQSQWDYASLESALLEEGGERYLNDFKVRGLQPRIAELAFHRVYGRLYGANAQEKLRDLNLERMKELRPPWSLDRKPNLPQADWEDVNGEKYDVKSNLFYRSQQHKNGLRGFLIEIKRSNSRHHSFPGFVFTDTDDESCSWVYVGEYQPTPSMGQTGDRVLPFYFRLPDSARFVPSTTDCDPSLGVKLLNDAWLRIGWQLAVGKVVPNHLDRTIAESLLDTFVERCVQKMAAGTFLECGLWKALTETTLDACCKYDRESVRLCLELANKLISSQALPIRLPRIDKAPILSRWITDVLQRLNEYWCRISCVRCGCSATEPGVIQLRITRMTSEGTVEGRMTCTRCNKVRNKVTLLTHCHECSHYPLIIGKNPVCKGCGGLICEWRGHDEEKRCKCCKKDCGQGQHTAEEHFVIPREMG